jgi:hypothetical protein
MVVCGMPQVLQQAAVLLKPGGQLLLLEHGKSSWSWLEKEMDKSAQAHYDKWGCWWNRDILDIVNKVIIMILTPTDFLYLQEIEYKRLVSRLLGPPLPGINAPFPFMETGKY